MSGLRLPAPGTLPLFPLPRTVLLPGSVLNLYVYEPRYKAMVCRCLKEEIPFGVLLLRPEMKGTPDEVAACRTGGCGQILWHKVVGKEGEMVITVKGLRRFRVLEFISGAPYLQGQVEYIDHCWTTDHERQELLDAVRQGLAKTLTYEPPALAKRADEMDELVDPAMLADVIIGGLPIEPDRKQEFLETIDPVARARMVVKILSREGFSLAVLDNLQGGESGHHIRN